MCTVAGNVGVCTSGGSTDRHLFCRMTNEPKPSRRHFDYPGVTVFLLEYHLIKSPGFFQLAVRLILTSLCSLALV